LKETILALGDKADDTTHICLSFEGEE
jgi:hypothetical protein